MQNVKVKMLEFTKIDFLFIVIILSLIVGLICSLIKKANSEPTLIIPLSALKPITVIEDQNIGSITIHEFFNLETNQHFLLAIVDHKVMNIIEISKPKETIAIH